MSMIVWTAKVRLPRFAWFGISIRCCMSDGPGLLLCNSNVGMPLWTFALLPQEQKALRQLILSTAPAPRVPFCNLAIVGIDGHRPRIRAALNQRASLRARHSLQHGASHRRFLARAATLDLLGQHLLCAGDELIGQLCHKNCGTAFTWAGVQHGGTHMKGMDRLQPCQLSF